MGLIKDQTEKTTGRNEPVHYGLVKNYLELVACNTFSASR